MTIRLYALEIYTADGRSILEVDFDEEARAEVLADHAARLGRDLTGYRMAVFEGPDLATAYVAVEENGATIDGRHWRDIPVTPHHSSADPRPVEVREPRDWSLDPADPQYRVDLAEMLEDAKAVAADLRAASDADPDDVDLSFHADTAAQVVNSLQIMAAASTKEMAVQQRDILWPIVSTCAINGWYDINGPIADFVLDTRRVAEREPVV